MRESSAAHRDTELTSEASGTRGLWRLPPPSPPAPRSAPRHGHGPGTFSIQREIINADTHPVALSQSTFSTLGSPALAPARVTRCRSLHLGNLSRGVCGFVSQLKLSVCLSETKARRREKAIPTTVRYYVQYAAPARWQMQTRTP